MEKLSVEKDILKILKNKDDENRNHAILAMLNGTYQYEINYLNNIPYHLMLIYLEKVIMLVTNNEFLPYNALKSLELLVDFSLNLPSFNEQDLEKQNKISLKYDLLLLKEKISQNKKRIQMVATFLLTITIFSSLYFHLTKNKEEVDTIETTPPPSISTVEERVRPHELLAASISDVMSFESDIKTKENEIEKIDLNSNVEIDKPTKISQEIEEDYIVSPVLVNESEKNISVSIGGLSKDEKIKYILEEYNLTDEQFNVVKAIVMAEAQAGSYKDGYAVINTMYNRTLSKNWLYTAENCYYDEFGNHLKLDGTNLYDVAISPDQFVVYQSGDYKRFLDVYEGPVYDAIIDFLMTKETIHDYAYFLSFDTEMTHEHELFDTRGNRYYGKILEEDWIDNKSKER